MILILIAIPSFTLALALDEELLPYMWVKVIGNQWYWTYEYSSLAGLAPNVVFDSFIVPTEELVDSSLRLLAVDNNLIVPFNKTVKFLITSNDVLHS